MGHYRQHVVDLSMSGDALVHVTLTPISYVFDQEVCHNLYNKDIGKFRVFDILDSVNLELSHSDVLGSGHQGVEGGRLAAMLLDRNFGPVGLYHRLIGTALSSLDFIIDLLVIVGGSRFSQKYHISIEEGEDKFISRMSGYNISRITSLVSPVALNKLVMVQNVPIQTLINAHSELIGCVQMLQVGIGKFGLFSSEIQKLMTGKISPPRKMITMYDAYPRHAPSAPSRDNSFTFDNKKSSFTYGK
jgi:hypothetical protein